LVEGKLEVKFDGVQDNAVFEKNRTKIKENNDYQYPFFLETFTSLVEWGIP